MIERTYPHLGVSLRLDPEFAAQAATQRSLRALDMLERAAVCMNHVLFAVVLLTVVLSP